MKDDWNRETVGQNLFGIEWKIGERAKELSELVLDFLWTYRKVNDKGEAVNILSRYCSANRDVFKHFISVS